MLPKPKPSTSAYQNKSQTIGQKKEKKTPIIIANKDKWTARKKINHIENIKIKKSVNKKDGIQLNPETSNDYSKS